MWEKGFPRLCGSPAALTSAQTMLSLSPALPGAVAQPLALEVGEDAEGGQRQQRQAERVRGEPPAAPAVDLVQRRLSPVTEKRKRNY